VNEDATRPLPVGKLPEQVLEGLLRRAPKPDSRVVVWPGVGEDAAVIDAGESYLVCKSDPITFAADRIGWYAVNVNANDIATTGARPRWFMVTALLPENGTTPQLAGEIFDDVVRACEPMGVSLVGGHTEITHGLDRPILVGSMIGEVEKDRLVRKDGARAGDVVILTKGVAIEGTAVIAREMRNRLTGHFPAAMLDRCADFLFEPGISVVKEALAANSARHVHAMHDPTEGGLATGLHELCRATGLGAQVDASRVPVLPETTGLCDHLGICSFGLIASGSMLIVVDPTDEDAVCEALEREKILAARIGTLTDRFADVRDVNADCQELWRKPEVDELARLFSE